MKKFRSNKKLKIEDQPLSISKQVELGQAPFGIKPLGAGLFDLGPRLFDRRRLGLGSLFVLEDELILSLLRYLSIESLCRMTCVSKALMIFASTEEIWKDHVLEQLGDDFELDESGSWKQTLMNSKKSGIRLKNSISVSDFYSDALFNRFFASHLNPIQSEWMKDNVVRRKKLSFKEFESEFLQPNLPVLIEDVVSEWPAFSNWNRENLLKRFGSTLCKTNQGVEMTLKNYFSYCDRNHDANPIYLFDNSFGERLEGVLEEYKIPIYFQEDFFSFLESSDRPSFRWILIGPARSEKDYTSAWNGLISGLKKWLLFPPDSSIPGVHPSEDGWVVETPDSIIEWFSDFYVPSLRCIEVLQKPGDLLFIPSGWWHCALNMLPSIAVTQNVVNHANWPRVSTFLKSKNDQTLWNKLSSKLLSSHPHLLEENEPKSSSNNHDSSVFTFNFLSE